MVVLGLFSLGGYVLGLSIDRRIMKKRHAKIEREFFALITKDKELIELSKRINMKNKILHSKIREFGCL